MPKSETHSRRHSRTEAQENLVARHERLRCTLEGPENVSVPDAHQAYLSSGLDNSFDMAHFKQNMKIRMKEHRVAKDGTSDSIQFDMMNVDAPIANAIRRILIAEVPTVAIEMVNIYQNNGVLHDEVLAHRLGLIPFAVEPDLLAWKDEKAELDASNSIRFTLHKKGPAKGTLTVYSSDFEWSPRDEQDRAMFPNEPPKPVHGDIIITKLRPGQEIELVCFAIKGVGKDHAKWSPVSTAWYRLNPVVTLETPFEGKEAEELKKSCPVGVFDIEDGSAFVKNARDCTTCRNCLEKFGDRVKLEKVKTHFIFTVESTGAIEAKKLLPRALGVLKEKAANAMKVLANPDEEK